MLEATIHEEATAVLNRLQEKHKGLKERLQKAYGYAVFPSVGRAGVVLGGAYGHGEVFEGGKPVGFATMSQITVGVQIGGQTFTQILSFGNKKSFERFKKRGKLGFTANASAVMVKAAATATNNVSDVQASAYSMGGMLLELSLGGSKFMFIPPLEKLPQNKPAPKEPSPEKTEQQSMEVSKEGSSTGKSEELNSSLGSSIKDGLGQWATKQITKVPVLGKILPHNGKHKKSPIETIAGMVTGAKKELSTNRVLKQEVEATLKMIEEAHPQFKHSMDQAYGYAIFPSVGRAGLVVGGAYGKGEVFEQKKLVGYAGIVQLTIGVQVGGETFDAVVLFADKEGLDRFKQGKIGFAANAGAVIVKAGAEATTKYQADKVYIFSQGGLLIEAAIGGQKFVFRPAVLTRKQPAEVK